MGELVYTQHVALRNSFGQFIRECEAAGEATIEEVVRTGARVSGAAAPKRTGRLAASIQPVMFSRTSGAWGSSLKYAAPQDQGAAPHDMPANVSFWWDRMGRMWMPPDVYLRTTGYPGNDPIHHPGNPATHFMRTGYDAVKGRLTAIAKSKYPG